MDSTVGRRAFLGGLGTTPLMAAGGAAAQDTEPGETFRVGLDLESYHALWSDGDAYYVGARVGDEDTVALIRVSLDGTVESRREIFTGEPQDSVIATAQRSDGGQVLLTRSALVSVDGSGRRDWGTEIEVESSLDQPDYWATAHAVTSVGETYVAGATLVDRNAGGTADQYDPWLQKYSADGEHEWTKRPDVEQFAGRYNTPGIGLLEARDDGVRIGLLRTWGADRVVTVLDIGGDGTVTDRFERTYEVHSLALRPTDSGYAGVIERSDTATDYLELVETDESLAITNRCNPDAPGSFQGYVRLEDGDYLVTTERSHDGEEMAHLSRVNPDGSTDWTVRTDGFGVAAAGEQYATLEQYDLVQYTEGEADSGGGTSGSLVDRIPVLPALGLVGLGLAGLGYGLVKSNSVERNEDQ